MKTIIMMCALLLALSEVSMAQNTDSMRNRNRINGQDTSSWHMPRRNPNDTPPGRQTINRKNMQPKGVNPDSSRTPGTKPMTK